MVHPRSERVTPSPRWLSFQWSTQANECEDKCFESCILSNCCDIDALFDVLQRSYNDRQSNLGTFLHAVQVSWIPNTIYSYFMSQFNSDKCYWLQTLSWTKYSQCMRFVKIKSQCENISVLLYFLLLLLPSVLQLMKFFTLLLGGLC